jgi:hypothetical protein
LNLFVQRLFHIRTWINTFFNTLVRIDLTILHPDWKYSGGKKFRDT